MVRCLLALTLLAVVTLSSAQDLENTDYKLTVDVALVQLPVSVLDKRGFPVRDLQQEHFIVYEDKVLQDISLFRQEDIPLSVGLVIDGSGSMDDKRGRVNTAAMTFVRQSNPHDQTSIVSFGDSVYLEQNFTDDTHELSQALTTIHSSGNTALYDGVFLAARHLLRFGSHEKKVLLVISDGDDNKSRYTLSDVIKVLRESKVIVYTVGLLNSGFSSYAVPGDTGKQALKQLAEVTGGASFFPKNAGEIEEVCVKIARDLRNQYTIGYRPSNRNWDGSWRKVTVRINPPKNTPKLNIRTKQGYYAPDSKEQTTQRSMK